MSKKANYSIPEKYRKSSFISLRCTPDMYEKIKKKAKKRKLSTSDYVIECVDTGLKKRRRGSKEKLRVLVENQEELNKIIKDLGPEQQGLRDSLIDCTREMMKLWEN